MLISHSHEFIFIHIQRTGGSSLSRLLEEYVDHPQPSGLRRTLRKLPFTRDPRKAVFSAHATAEQVRRRWPREDYERYFKFAIVRNPWSWLVSLHARIGSSQSHRHHQRVSRMSFPEYVQFEIERDARHQHRFVCAPDGQLIIDFVGRLENLQHDTEQACEQIGIGIPDDVPKLGSRPHPPWRSQYDDATRDAVARHWKRDIELFGYSFEGVPTRTSDPC